MGNVAVGALRRQREPRIGCPPVADGVIPRDGGATAITTARIDDTVGRNLRIEQPQFLPGIEEGRTPQAEQQHGCSPSPGLRTAVAVAVAGVVVVRQHPCGPGVDGIESAGGGVDHLAPAIGVPFCVQGWKVERQVELVTAPVVTGHTGHVEEVDLAHHHAVALVAIHDAPQVSQDRVGFGSIVQDDVGQADRLRGSSAKSGSLPSRCATSMRTPSTPRSNQKRSTPCMASTTRGLDQSRSGCCGRKQCR